MRHSRCGCESSCSTPSWPRTTSRDSRISTCSPPWSASGARAAPSSSRSSAARRRSSPRAPIVPWTTLPAPATDEMMLQVRRGRPYVSLDTDAVGGYVIRAAAPIDATANSQSHVLIALYPGAPAALPTRRHGTALLHPVREPGAAAPPAQVHVRVDSDLRRADVAHRGGVRRFLRRPAARAAGAGSDRGHPRRGQGQLRHAAAAALARRARVPRHLVQRHDQALEQSARGDAPQPAGRGGGARGTGGDPRPALDGCRVARAGSDHTHRQSGGERDPRRRSRGRRRSPLR